MCIVAQLYLVCYILCLIILLFVAFCQLHLLSFHTILFLQILSVVFWQDMSKTLALLLKGVLLAASIFYHIILLNFGDNVIFFFNKTVFYFILLYIAISPFACRTSVSIRRSRIILHIFSFFHKNLLLYFFFSAKIAS